MIRYNLVGDDVHRKHGSFLHVFCLFFAVLCLISGGTLYFIMASDFNDFISKEKGQDISSAFEDFISQYHRSYKTTEEKEKRKIIFASNYLKIQKYNLKKDRTVTLGINKFADLSDEEYAAQYLTERPIPENVAGPAQSSNYKGTIEENIDWVTKGLVNKVKDQGQCGSCWTFGSISIVESRYAKVEGKLLTFSEQQLVDCCRTSESKGCLGGIVEDAVPCIAKTGIAQSFEYPYRAMDQECKIKNVKNLYKAAEGYKQVQVYNQTEMQIALLNHTMYVSVNASPFVFRFYKKGVITEGCPGNTRNHGVTLVGSGKTGDGIDYWKVRNSWGPNWGDHGYVLIQRNFKDTGYGVCGIACHAVYPLYREDK